LELIAGKLTIMVVALVSNEPWEIIWNFFNLAIRPIKAYKYQL